MDDGKAELAESVISQEDLGRVIYDQAMTLWVNPEILRRHEQGLVTLPLVLRHAQIIFGLDGTYKVRLNQEVRGVIRYRLARNVEAGEVLTFSDVDAAIFAEKAPEDKDFGHITIMSLGDNKYSLSFDFEYGAANVLKYLSLGDEFLEQAHATVRKSPRSATSLGMTAAENFLKARMAASPLVELNIRTHAGLMKKFSMFVRQNENTRLKSEYVGAYKFFKNHFDGSRYNPDALPPIRDEINKNLQTLKEMSEETLALTQMLDATSLKSRKIKISPVPPSVPGFTIMEEETK